jgi:hypothetical protein
MERQEESRSAARRQRVANERRGDREAEPGGAGTLANSTVQRLLRGVARKGNDSIAGNTVDDAIARAIQSKRGSGQGLPDAARRDMEGTLGDDFADVRVHTDAEADGLNKAVQAEAFTTGTDIFFRSGRYDPASDDGRKLLAHELTHVVQQRGAPPAADMRVSSPDDASERQASAVADHAGGVARQETPEEEELQTSTLAREEMPEEELQTSPLAREELPEEELQTAPLAREEMPEEELQTAPLAREEMPEEELQTSSLTREEAPEEEELQMSPLAREAMPEEEELQTSPQRR